jgi:flagellar export protein FliJ
MKRYVFSLNRVLRVRATQETVARQALRNAAEHAAQADDDYDVKLRNYEANVASAASMRGTILNVLAMRDLSVLRAKAVVEAAREQQAAHVELDAASSAWTEAKQRLSPLEKLDERQQAQYRAEQEKAEQAEADDLVAGRARRAPSLRLTPGEGEPQ